ncbi:probable indole-3-acetic acid-amido synthetase GH3.8 [Acanthaster planci]|uniref:Probable indole-3-acetic acid-amido synthetase GH3.8 n=1 Tax=Acanthaster planci TaxID=133434 RepID=A0A8B7Z0Z8_ACAPL|nr:probable indole-3-acetic acid-amido synthetase GH3.8 [Acanthaster planci]
MTDEFPLGARTVGVLSLISSLIAFHISSLRCSASHTLTSLLLSYKRHQGERLATPFIWVKANHTWKHPRETQEDLIRELTRRHAKTEYGRKNRLGEIQSLDDLRKKHPLTTYDHFKDYIQRLADGEEGLFLDEKPVRFAVTSGTTGIGKKIPLVNFWIEGDAQTRIISRLAMYRGTHTPSPVQKRGLLYTHKKALFTKSDQPVTPYTYIHHRDFKRLSDLSSPPLAFTITHEPSAMYVHMLFAIDDPNLALLSSMFTPQLFRALKSLETNWPAMLEDLSTGQINSKIPLIPDVRRSLEDYLRPDPARVSQLRREFEKGFHGIVKRIWPHLVATEGIDILGFREKLEETYSFGVPCVSWGYGGTEGGVMAANLWIHEKEPQYVFFPISAVFEFIPEENNLDEDPKTLLIDEVEVGARYELVMTTRSGLYRYRNGDIIQIVGFHENCPVMRMLYRTGEHVNLFSEKMNTQVIRNAMKVTFESWPGIHLVEWTVAESPLYDPNNSELYYILFVEVDPGEGELNVTQEQKAKFDECLQQEHAYYKFLRGSNTVSPAQVKLVRPGTFSELRDFTVSHTTASVNQYKTPRKLRTRKLIEWMMERRVIESGAK